MNINSLRLLLKRLIVIDPDLTIEMIFQQTDNKGTMHNQR